MSANERHKKQAMSEVDEKTKYMGQQALETTSVNQVVATFVNTTQPIFSLHYLSVKLIKPI